MSHYKIKSRRQVSNYHYEPLTEPLTEPSPDRTLVIDEYSSHRIEFFITEIEADNKDADNIVDNKDVIVTINHLEFHERTIRIFNTEEEAKLWFNSLMAFLEIKPTVIINENSFRKEVRYVNDIIDVIETEEEVDTDDTGDSGDSGNTGDSGDSGNTLLSDEELSLKLGKPCKPLYQRLMASQKNKGKPAEHGTTIEVYDLNGSLYCKGKVAEVMRELKMSHSDIKKYIKFRDKFTIFGDTRFLSQAQNKIKHLKGFSIKVV